MFYLFTALFSVFLFTASFADNAKIEVIEPVKEKVAKNFCSKHCKPGKCVTNTQKRMRCAKRCSAEVNAACNTKQTPKPKKNKTKQEQVVVVPQRPWLAPPPVVQERVVVTPVPVPLPLPRHPHYNHRRHHHHWR